MFTHHQTLLMIRYDVLINWQTKNNFVRGFNLRKIEQGVWGILLPQAQPTLPIVGTDEWFLHLSLFCWNLRCLKSLSLSLSLDVTLTWNGYFWTKTITLEEYFHKDLIRTMSLILSFSLTNWLLCVSLQFKLDSMSPPNTSFYHLGVLVPHHCHH